MSGMNGNKKIIKFESAELINQIQAYADKHYGGNFTLAVNKICEKAVKVSNVNS